MREIGADEGFSLTFEKGCHPNSALIGLETRDESFVARLRWGAKLCYRRPSSQLDKVIGRLSDP